MPAFKATLFPFDLARWFASPTDRAAVAPASTSNPAAAAAPPRRPGFLLVLLRALSAWGT